LFTHLSASSSRIVRAAEQDCRNRNQYYVGVEHVLLALLEDDDPEVEARLRERGIERKAAHGELRRAMGVGEERTWEGILITPRTRHAFEKAERSADGSEIRPVHILEAIMDEGGLPVDLLGAA
jgi:ATP-dependent Clp protease ATP-binding subunit ClpA